MNKIGLLTGASGGIGEATARILAAAGMTVVLGARRIDRLQQLASQIAAAGGAARVRALDAIGRAILHAISQPANVDTTEIVVRPVANAA